MYVWVLKCVVVCMCELFVGVCVGVFCNVWVCIYLGFVVCGCVCVCFVMCGCVYVWVL